MFEDNEPWEKGVPADLVPAIKHLRKLFGDVHFKFGSVTRTFCYSKLHNESVHKDLAEYAKALSQLLQLVNPAASKQFHQTLLTGTPSAIFKGYLDLYLAGLEGQVILIFKALAVIGEAHESRLGATQLEWAVSQTKHLIRSSIHEIDAWIREVCDKQPYDPSDEFHEQIYWTKWQAPLFLVMKPSGNQTYDGARAWERTDEKTSLAWRKSFCEHYVFTLEAAIERAAGKAAVQLAMRPRPTARDLADGSHHEQMVENCEVGQTDEQAKAIERLLQRVSSNKAGSLRTAEAALLFGVTTMTINRWISDGQLRRGAKRGTVTNESLRQKIAIVG